MTENLYTLSHELALINDELEETGGELSESLEQKLDAANLSFIQKAEGIGKWVLNLSGQTDMLSHEIERLQGRKKAVEAHQKRLKEYVLNAMVAADKTKIELGTFNITVCKNPSSVEVLDEHAIPARFLTVRTENIIDRKGILNALRLNEVVEGARLAPVKTNLRIK